MSLPVAMQSPASEKVRHRGCDPPKYVRLVGLRHGLGSESWMVGDNLELKVL